MATWVSYCRYHGNFVPALPFVFLFTLPRHLTIRRCRLVYAAEICMIIGQIIFVVPIHMITAIYGQYPQMAQQFSISSTNDRSESIKFELNFLYFFLLLRNFESLAECVSIRIIFMVEHSTSSMAWSAHLANSCPQVAPWTVESSTSLELKRMYCTPSCCVCVFVFVYLRPNIWNDDDNDAWETTT